MEIIQYNPLQNATPCKKGCSLKPQWQINFIPLGFSGKSKVAIFLCEEHYKELDSTKENLNKATGLQYSYEEIKL